MFEDRCSFANFNKAIAKRQSQGKQHPHNDKFTLFYELSGFDITPDSDGWEALLYHIRSLEDKTVFLKVLTSNCPKSALISLLNKATDSPNLKSRDTGMLSTSRNDTERDSGLKIVNQNNFTSSESSKLLQTIEEKIEPDRTLSVTQRENVMKELISKSFIEKQSKTCKVKHTYQTIGEVNVHELNKKIRSVNVKGAELSEALPELKQSAAKLEQLIESNKDRLNV